MAHHWSDPQENQMSREEFEKMFAKGASLELPANSQTVNSILWMNINL